MKTELARTTAFPAPRPRHVEVRETHASCVFLGERDVYKVKKPVDFGFLDFRTVEARRKACDAEVTLNRRLAPDVYLGVVPVVCRRGGALAFGGKGALVDWAVHMRRMPDEARFDVRLRQGTLEAMDIDTVAGRLARFHAEARSDDQTATFGSIDAIRRNVTENFSQTHEVITRHVSVSEAAEIEAWQLSFLDHRAGLFDERIARHRIRDGHGDLRLEHVYVAPDGALTILDCIEFSDRFRIADVCADVAFLSMDLAWNGRVDLAERFLARYASASGDYDLYRLVDFYESYRAYVRGKVATFVAADPSIFEDTRRQAELEARRYFLLALAGGRRALVPPVLVCVGGIIAAGKSTIAAAISQELSAPVIEADLTRKQMLGMDPSVHANDAAWTGAYAPAVTERVYAEVFQRATAVLSSGRPVVIDASFRSERQRGAARACARAMGVPVRFIECRADRVVACERLARRTRESTVSDGRLAILDDFLARFEPMTELPPAEHLVVDTSGDAAPALAAIRSHVATWPRGLVS